MSLSKLKVGDVVQRLSGVTSNAQREAWWLLSTATGLSEHHLIQQASEARNPTPVAEIELSKMLSPTQADNFERMLTDRIEHRKPLQYVLGDVEFCNLKLRTKPPILIPRPETEQMSAWLIERYRALEGCRTSRSPLPAVEPVTKLRGFFVHKFKPSSFDAIKSPTVVARSALQSPAFNLLDICSGSGNIALSVASQFPLANVLGADLDERAVRLARENGTINGVLNAYFTHCDVFADRRAASAAAAPGSDIAPAVSAEPVAAAAAPQGLFDLQVRTENKNFYTSTLTQRESPQAERSSARSLLFDVLVSNPPYVTAAEHEGLQPEVRDWENRDALVPNVPAGARRQVASHASELSASVHWPTVAEVDAHALHFYERIIWCSPRLLRPIDELWLLNRMSTPLPTFTHSANTAMGNANAEAAAAAAPPLMATVERAVLSQVPRVVLEIGTEAQAVPVAEMLKAQGFRPEMHLDAGENVRWVVGYHR